MRRGLNPEDYERRSGGGVSWRVLRGRNDAALQAILADPERVLSEADPIKHGRSARVVRASPYVLKRFQQKRAWNRLLDGVRGDRGSRNAVAAAVLSSIAVATPRVVAFAARRRLGLVVCAYLVTEEIAPAVTLAAALAGPVEPATFAALGAAVARIHAAGFSHRDLKATNVLVDPTGAVVLVDLDGLRRRAITDARREADLARLFRDLDRRPDVAAAARGAVLDGYAAARAAIAATRGA